MRSRSSGLARQQRSEKLLGGKWRIEYPINTRRFTDAYAATDEDGQNVVLKVLRKGATRESSLRKRFMREYLVAKAVDHPGVVRMLERDVLPDGSPVLVMERLEGETLEERRRTQRGGRLPTIEAVLIVLDILDVLAAAHAKGITHGSIRPTKVMLTVDGVVKLLELGAMSETMSPYERGRLHFMAPEQTTLTSPMDARTDIFGVGATLFTLLSGQYPYGSMSVIDYLSVCGLEGPQSLKYVARDLSPALVAIVDRALEVDPAKRFANAASMASALRRAIDGPESDHKTHKINTKLAKPAKHVKHASHAKHEKPSSMTIALATVPRLPVSRSTTIPPAPRAAQSSGVSWYGAHTPFPPSHTPSLPLESHERPIMRLPSRPSYSSHPSHPSYPSYPSIPPTMMATEDAALRARATTVQIARRLDQRLIAVFLGFALALLIGATVRVVQALMEDPAQIHAMAPHADS